MKARRLLGIYLLAGSLSLASCNNLFGSGPRKRSSEDNGPKPNIVVGTVSDKSISFSNIKILGIDDTDNVVETSRYSFNPKASDNMGRVRFGGNENGQEGERLSLTVKGEITEAQNLGSLKVSFDSIPEALQNAVTAQYVVLPTCASKAKDVAYTLSGEGSKIASFEYEIAFTWGAAFDGENPGDYYDDGHKGANISTDSIVETIESLHELLDDFQIHVTFVATPN